ncbi:type II toxin-antitoxin system HicB family antitoxin [Nitrosomonas ureae]|uniref:Antitoxin HicB n=1 Tax=Nitrosomonas ureae TaxID=44577 RepID=A0A2T5ISN7_9PROT|nr:type II toxin-antitoxin system HicB family antitoxin [Nitrosomonas ureae]PTQ86848.1 antitoxin HicB [Nitrosomonas ureae]
MNTLFPAIFTPEEPSGFSVQFVDIPGAITEGETIEECLFNAAEALSGVIESYIKNGQEIPRPSKNVKDAYYIAPDVKIQSALLIRWARGDKSLAEIARVLETSWPAAQRLENPNHWATLKQLDKAAAALGKKLVLSLE